MAGNVCRRLFSSRKIISSTQGRRDNTITTAGIISDEILKGEVPDTNSNYLAQELHKLGLQLKKILVVGDCVLEVSNEVKQFSSQYDYVLTSGGIGPTHDDITFEAVAKAFNKPLVLNPFLRDLCMQFYKTSNVNCPGMKLAYIPQTAELNFNPDIQDKKNNYPNVSIKNVYMFPGIPQLLRKSFKNVGTSIFKSNKMFYSLCIYFNVTEDKIVNFLNEVVKEFPTAKFGSYPILFNNDYQVKVTIESNEESITRDAYEKLLLLVPKEYIVILNDSK